MTRPLPNLSHHRYDPRPVEAPRAPVLPKGWEFEGVEWWPPQPKLVGFVPDDDKSFCAEAHVPGQCRFVMAWATTAIGAIETLERALEGRPA